MSAPTDTQPPTGSTTLAEPTDPTTSDPRALLSRWRSSSLRPGRRAAAVAAALLVVALVIVVAVSAVLVSRHAAVDSDRVAAEAAARSAVPQLLSYDSADLAPARTAVDQLTTGPFHDQFVGVFSQVVAPNATAQHAKSSADVRASGVVSADPGRVVVLLFLNQDTSSNQLPADRVDTIQTRVTMTEVDGTWLVAGLDQV